MERGYVKLWRKVEDSGLFGHPVAWTLFSYLLVKASRLERKVSVPSGAITLKPGQWISGRKKLAADLKVGEQAIRTAIHKLEIMENLTTHSCNEYTVFTILNWDAYQGTNQPLTNPQPTPNQPLTTKQERENVEREKEPKPKPRALTAPDFEEFWKAYPKKKAKGEAFKAWREAKPDLQTCLAALAWQRKEASWNQDEGKWIPWPQKWIKGQRWLDERESGRGKGTGEVYRPSPRMPHEDDNPF